MRENEGFIDLEDAQKGLNRFLHPVELRLINLGKAFALVWSLLFLLHVLVLGLVLVILEKGGKGLDEVCLALLHH